jgi:hypothetical protein
LLDSLLDLSLLSSRSELDFLELCDFSDASLLASDLSPSAIELTSLLLDFFALELLSDLSLIADCLLLALDSLLLVLLLDFFELVLELFLLVLLLELALVLDELEDELLALEDSLLELSLLFNCSLLPI